MAPLLNVRRVVVELYTATALIRPVNDVSFQLSAGESLALVGESGSGKTMLALALMNLLPEGARASGEVWLAGREDQAARQNLLQLSARERRSVRGREIAMIFQEPMTALDPVMRIGAQIAEAVRTHEPSRSSSDVERRVRDALQRVAVPQPEVRARQFPHQLSGGLRQRVMIAMALAMIPRLLIADEPTTALDVTVQKQILDLLVHLRTELGLTLIFITHDLAVAGQIADRMAVMYAGRIIEEGPAKELLRRPRHPYTEGLLRASPSLRRRKLEPIAGMVPPLDALPPGCSFEPRCPVRQPACTLAVPEPRTVAPDHSARCILVGESR